jgi:hypothetical protein
MPLRTGGSCKLVGTPYHRESKGRRIRRRHQRGDLEAGRAYPCFPRVAGLSSAGEVLVATEQDAATRVIARGAPRMPENVCREAPDVAPSSQSWSCSTGV